MTEPSRIARLIAVVAGIAGVVLCGLVPLLPVEETTATIQWPQGTNADGNVTEVTAPLVAGAPRALDVTIPCRTVAELPADGGVVFSTNPAGGIEAGRNGMFVRANADVVYVAFRDTVAAVAPRDAVDSGACSEIHVWADVATVGADFVGIPGANGTLPVDKRPQVAGVFTDLKVPAQPGLSARIDVDTRFITSPTLLKTAVMVLGVGCVIASLVALALLDRGWRRRPPRTRGRVGVWTWLTDAGVIGGLLVWHIVGAPTSDDGYNTTIARVAADAGYTTNYYRYFGASEAPFDWYQSVLAHLAAISTDSVWLRLPATAAAIATWLLISRCVLPRIGRRVAANRVAMLTAGATFLAAWLPFNNGLRPEPLIAFAVIAVWMLVENSIGTRRLWPAAVAIVIAMFSVTLAPQGLIALAPLLVGARAIGRVVSARRAATGILAALAPLAASAALVFVIIFRDQTLATVAEAVRIKYVVGPTIPWYQEFLRYYFLTVEDSVDGSLTRRFAVLVLLLCLFGLIMVSLRRGRVPGAVSGPLWRLTGSTAIGLLLLIVTPTKWAIQFGAFAGLAGALGGVTAFAFARVGLHSRRNLALYVTALLFILAWATSGLNGWFYVGNYGVPWFDKQPVIFGYPVTTIFLVLAIAGGLLVGWLHFRMDYAGHTEVADTGRNRALASTPLLIVATIMVVLELGSMVKATVGRYPVYTTGSASIAALRAGLSGESCAMADAVLVEADPNEGMLQPVPGQRFGEYGPLGGEDPVGFTPNGVSDTLEPAEPVAANPGTPNSDGPVDKPNIGIGYAAGTGGGYGPEGVNGSRVFLPFGLDPARTPVMGSYGENTVAAKATSAWYQLPPRTPDRPLVTVAAAGAIWYYEEDGSFNYGQSLKLQWGVHRPDGSYQALSEVQPIDIFQQKAWRNLRFPLAWAPPEANVARIVADDPNLSEDQWFAFTPPRVPVLQTAQDYLGTQTPVLMDIATAANFPCQRPFAERLGVAELPEYRIIPNFKQMVVSSNQWQSAADGGPFLFIQALLRTEAIPTYLRDDWYRDWGSIERYIRVVPQEQAPTAAIEEGSTRVFGWSRGGPIRALP
ncbi:arabinosyltransferase domain-containing protein [Mycolicibacterium goodii]|uniref:Arabinosyltransferase domain-containing protein n=1 Tax=Mycolicibacterium goodii TaxID=134601 RepID=A0ABS6HSE7_MYCGD|nr:arabinosyltransferase domain-containing protein [Mycolicibacterium goodii]MBU8825138.1 arabinosyltransferase domain-containing protein [Mycolicibacterium goodii]MBU8838144.1 arabinosyltransferase domain-containing protein [Mycolicibacterium goodii]OKH70413.1 arabinosyltransferase [Mycobacterium sp. SWH-M5]